MPTKAKKSAADKRKQHDTESTPKKRKMKRSRKKRLDGLLFNENGKDFPPKKDGQRRFPGKIASWPFSSLLRFFFLFQ